MRRLLPALILVLMAPLVTELLSGSTPLGQPIVLAVLLPIYLPLYGAGALLIRELVCRSGRGWASILLLGAAYGFVEEGFGTQSLFHPTLYHAADWGARFLGINGVFAETVIVIHAVWSVAIPILLTDLLFPARRTMPYMGRFGLVVTGICYVLGVALLCLVARAFFAPGYEASPLLLSLTALVTLALVVVALALLPRKARQPVRENSAPHPWMVLLIIGIGGFIWHAMPFLWHIQPMFSRWPFVLVPMLSAAALLAGIAWQVNHWSQAHDWSDLHLLALVCGALACHTLTGLLSPDLTHTLTDRVALIVLALAMAGFLTWFAFRVRRRVARHDHPAKGFCQN
ncbi:hypothetical protein KSF_101510 [Reticulibacter mediterranei]|uniref:Uncharacterized protein n=1 Tax=Reticulibacter mediterranei TaxID=2778369 RepID=A0A8J3N8V9_9CHLR|nr:hypothetical protein [Reticulibacter mediterranei]GHP00104.1 hypothetical protein KSF_101510 [Reticulibacter mediterranei]